MGLVKMSWGAPFPPPQILKHQHLTVLTLIQRLSWLTCRLQSKPTASPLERFDDKVRNPVRQRISFSGSGAGDNEKWRSDCAALPYAMFDGAALLRI